MITSFYNQCDPYRSSKIEDVTYSEIFATRFFRDPWGALFCDILLQKRSQFGESSPAYGVAWSPADISLLEQKQTATTGLDDVIYKSGIFPVEIKFFRNVFVFLFIFELWYGENSEQNSPYKSNEKKCELLATRGHILSHRFKTFPPCFGSTSLFTKEEWTRLRGRN